MQKPQTPTIAASDPLLDAQLAQGQSDQLRALQTQAQGDTASLMARYGARLAMAGAAAGTPLPSVAAMPGRVA
jgi:hypothetical protein